MDLRAEITYAAEPGTVFDMLADEEFRNAVCRATGSTDYDVSITRGTRDTGTGDGDGMRVRIRRVMPADVPDFAKKFVGDHIEIVQTEEWEAPADDGRRTARLRIEIPGKPGSVDGRIELSPSGSGSRELITGQIKVSIPLVGRKLEGEVHHGITAATDVEGRVGRKWLAQE